MVHHLGLHGGFSVGRGLILSTFLFNTGGYSMKVALGTTLRENIQIENKKRKECWKQTVEQHMYNNAAPSRHLQL
jgi:hypothetical protein